IFRLILAGDFIPQVGRAVGGDLLKYIISKLFVLALVAMLLGFFGYIGNLAFARYDRAAANPAPVISINITFQTLDDNKDRDTRIVAQIKSRDGRVLAELDGLTEEFPDHSKKGPYTMRVLLPFTDAELRESTLVLTAQPVGHDTWRFNAALDIR